MSNRAKVVAECRIELALSLPTPDDIEAIQEEKRQLEEKEEARRIQRVTKLANIALPNVVNRVRQKMIDASPPVDMTIYLHKILKDDDFVSAYNEGFSSTDIEELSYDVLKFIAESVSKALVDAGWYSNVDIEPDCRDQTRSSYSDLFAIRIAGPQNEDHPLYQRAKR